MALSQSVKESLEDASAASLRNAVAFAAHVVKTHVCKGIAEMGRWY